MHDVHVTGGIGGNETDCRHYGETSESYANPITRLPRSLPRSLCELYVAWNLHCQPYIPCLAIGWYTDSFHPGLRPPRVSWYYPVHETVADEASTKLAPRHGSVACSEFKVSFRIPTLVPLEQAPCRSNPILPTPLTLRVWFRNRPPGCILTMQDYKPLVVSAVERSIDAVNAIVATLQRDQSLRSDILDLNYPQDVVEDFNKSSGLVVEVSAAHRYLDTCAH